MLWKPAYCAAVFAFALPEGVWARDPAIRLERIEVGDCSRAGVIELFVSELELEGTFRGFPPIDYRLSVDERVQAEPASSAESFAATHVPLRIALVVQDNLAYASEFGAISTAVQSFLSGLPARTDVCVITYANAPKILRAHVGPEAAAAAIGALGLEHHAGSAALAAFRTGLELLGPSTPGTRRLLVLTSDGLDPESEKEAFRSFGNLARSRAVPIEPIGYAPSDERGPLLNLGELAKRSNGTFRWAEDRSRLSPELGNLNDEINRQLVLTFRMEDRCQNSHQIQIVRADLRSNPRVTPALEVRSIPGRLVGFAAVVGLLVLGHFGLRSRRRKILS